MAIAHAIGARDKGATCRICGQPALPVVRLCAQCKAALKRVRHDTVSQHMPVARRPRRGQRSPATTAGADVTAGARRRGKGGLSALRAPFAVAALLAIIGSAGYFIVQQIHAAMPPERDSTLDTESSRMPTTAMPPAIDAAPTPPVPSASATLPGTTGEAAAGLPKPKVAARMVKPAPAPVAPPPPAVHPELPPAPVVVAAAPPPAVRPPDPMQLLAQAIAQCPNDGVLARMVCEQKARVRYCDGYWGQTPNCPNGAPDRGLSH